MIDTTRMLYATIKRTWFGGRSDRIGPALSADLLFEKCRHPPPPTLMVIVRDA